MRTHCCRHKCFPVCPRAQHLLRTQILCPGHKNVSDFVQKHFVSATNVSQFAQPKKHDGQRCVGNNVSSFTRAFRALKPISLLDFNTASLCVCSNECFKRIYDGVVSFFTSIQEFFVLNSQSKTSSDFKNPMPPDSFVSPAEISPDNSSNRPNKGYGDKNGLRANCVLHITSSSS